jgi:hypothetical protein
LAKRCRFGYFSFFINYQWTEMKVELNLMSAFIRLVGASLTAMWEAEEFEG